MHLDPQQPDERTINDGYRLSLLAAQLERTKEGDLDFLKAWEAWKKGIDYTMDQYHGKEEPELRFDSIDFKIYKLADALDLMGFVTNKAKGSDQPDQQWKNTIRKKFKRHKIEEEEIEQKISIWEKLGVPDYEIDLYKNEKVKLIFESYGVKKAVGFGIMFPRKRISEE